MRVASAARADTAGSVAGSLPGGPRGWFAGGTSVIRVGLVGCGGRGTGAALQALAADPAVRIVALGDLFADQVDVAAAAVSGAVAGRAAAGHAEPVRVVGKDACAGVLAAGVDLVILATPPACRPDELEAAVAAGCHVYCEAPVAIDAPGCQRAARALAAARQRGLVVASGLAYRHDAGTAAVIDRIHAGAIGTPRSVIMVAETGLPWRVPHRPGMSTAEWRQRNWISFADLGGGPLVERQIHAIDKALWVLGDVVPVSASGRLLPGRRDRWSIGDVTDGMCVRYRFGSGVSLHVHCRRDGTGDGIGHEAVHGRAGFADLRSGIVGPRDGDREARAGGEAFSVGPCAADGSRYQVGMNRLVTAIASGVPVDDGPGLVRATAVAILGREAARHGRTVDFAMLGLPPGGTNRLFDTAVTIGQAVKTV
jgi:predicted dehydrogenase